MISKFSAIILSEQRLQQLARLATNTRITYRAPTSHTNRMEVEDHSKKPAV